MNLTAVKERLLQVGQKMELQVEEETATSLTLHTTIVAESYFDDSVYIRFVVFESGTIHAFFTFGEMERTYDNFYLINTFNSENPWFRAYITNLNGKDYLELHYVAIDLDSVDQVAISFGYILNDLLKEDILKLLKPILTNGKLKY